LNKALMINTEIDVPEECSLPGIMSPLNMVKAAASNSLAGNNISNNNGYGIRLGDSSVNVVKENNFIDNSERNAYFVNSFLNRWFKNYWDDWSKLLPRPIYGSIYLERFDKYITWFNFDWHPAREPYDIGG